MKINFNMFTKVCGIAAPLSSTMKCGTMVLVGTVFVLNGRTRIPILTVLNRIFRSEARF